MMKNEGSATTLVGPWGPEGLGGACVKLGFATREQVQECLTAQATAIEAGKPAPRLGELLVERGYVTPQQVAEVLSTQGQSITTCLRCRIQFNVALDRPAAALLCPRCHHPLSAVPRVNKVAVVEDLPIVLPEEPLPVEVLRASQDPTLRFGKYILLKELGRGGSGVVHLAWDSFLGQQVALKRLQSIDGEVGSIAVWEAQRILVEARSTIRLRHPSIVRIYDAGQIDQVHYISMEYVEGRSLDSLTDESAKAGRISPYHENPVKALTLLAGVARALGYAHSRPAAVVHCDLKPSNIMVDSEGLPRLLDFGLARVLTPKLDQDMEICGTPGYMAPEQAQGRTADIDARTDVYGFGALLYEMLTGLPPFRGRPDAILRAVVSKAPTAPSDVLREIAAKVPGASPRPVPAFLEDLCMRCLSKEKDRRPSSMLEVCELLERAARPAPSPSMSVTHVPGPSERRRAKLKILVRRAGALTSAASLLLAAFVTFRGGAHQGAPAIDASDVEARLVSFQPDRALSLVNLLKGEGRLKEESRRIQGLRDEMEARLPVRLDALSLRDASLYDVVLERGESGQLKAGDRVVSWSDLEPSQIISLARATGAVEDPERRFALGLYCARVGRRFDARTLFESLRGSVVEAAARPYLASTTPFDVP
ncbi:MAG TPA: protein kinase [Planctomycetota bacterium]